MKILDWLISLADNLFRLLIANGRLPERERSLNQQAQIYGNSVTMAVRDSYASVDAKSAAILQHVSIMIAVSGLLYSQASIAPTFAKIFLGEMLVYIFLALFCLRLLMGKNLYQTNSETLNVVAKDALVDVTAQLTFLVTIILVTTVIVETFTK